MTNITELALKRYSEFIDTFNKFKLTDNDVDINSFNPADKLKSFYENISNNEKLFKYLLNRDKLLFHKNNKITFIPKINVYYLIDSNVDEELISFLWETIQMIYLIIADSQENKKQVQVSALLDKLDGLGSKKGSIDIKKITNAISKIDSSLLTEFLSISGLDKIDLTSIDIKQLHDIKNITPDKVKNIVSTLGLDKIDINNVIEKLAEKGDPEKGKKYITDIINMLIDEYNRDAETDKMDALLDFAIEKAQDRLNDFITNGVLSIYDVIAGCKLIKDSKDSELVEKLKNSKLFKDGSTISIKEVISRLTSKIMTQLGKDKAHGNISPDQMSDIEEFLKNQKI